MADPKIIHVEVTGRDQAALQKYYSDLFGWTLNTDNPGAYGMTEASPTGVVVGIGADQTGGAGWVTFYVRVESIDATIARAIFIRRAHARQPPRISASSPIPKATSSA